MKHALLILIRVFGIAILAHIGTVLCAEPWHWILLLSTGPTWMLIYLGVHVLTIETHVTRLANAEELDMVVTPVPVEPKRLMAPAIAAGNSSARCTDMLTALTNLGWKKAHAARAAKTAMTELPGGSFEDQVRRAIAIGSGR